MNKDIFQENGISLPKIEAISENDNPSIIVKFTNGNWNWYVVAGDKLENGDYLLFGLVDGLYSEIGTFTLSQIKGVSAYLTFDFDNIGLLELFKNLNGE